MRFREKKRSEEQQKEDEQPPDVVGLRDRIAHFTWYVSCDLCYVGV
jgi:hypothetical protein